ncbi:YybH family protein [Streptomyces albidus (ex Kaewkla and Franco 2022)]|uniref:YybH family protein n=1 Tax=Streptomyces albidus (ex Kaewkla and Franco 2022) TaxID=722709 RepID=UPI0015EE8F74|nr:nuclear transport factor 2 family protein [Streptomyces albidus (ex Kaewkla and Franco 2022)]
MSVLTNPDTAQVHELIEARSQSLRIKDAAALNSYYAPEVTSFTLDPPLLHTGRDIEGTAAWLDTWNGTLGYDVTRLDVTVGGDAAFAHSLDRMRGEKSDGGPVELWFRNTVCLERRHGRWLITHEHQSVPFRMDGSGKAALDLVP